MQPGDLIPSEYRQQIDSDLARRSSAGGFVYLGFVVALWATTGYFSLYPTALAALSAISAVAAIMRLYLGRRFQSLYARNPRAWRTAYFLAVNLNILAWGVFLAITFLLFGYEDWKTLLLLICLAGTAPIALASLSPDLLVLRSFLFALSLPMIGANLYLGGTRGYSMAMVFSWYLLFAMIHAHTIHRQYMRYTQEKFALAAAKTSAEEANKVKAEFLAHMSHELKTPMNAIFGMTHLALNSPPGADQQQYLHAVKSSAEALLKMLDGLLDFSKIEAGKLELENIEFSVRDLVDETLQSFSGDLQRKGLRIESRVDEDVPLRLRGDPLRLRQVLVNVVGNAVKFTSEGEIEVRISRLDAPAGQATLQFMVRDTGIGIAPGKHRSIFEAFEQADSSTTRKYGGSGLGLAISSRILELMGGRMWVESEPGLGSSFYWTATFTELAIEESARRRDPEKSKEAHTPVRVLIAEDHELSRSLLKKLLEMRDHHVTAVSNGREVLEEIKRQTFDIVLMDVHMPELDGVEATAEIRRQKQAGPQIPIVAVTADSAVGLREYYLAKGFTEYLSKPIKPEALFALIDDLVTRQLQMPGDSAKM
jgi:signal transduction histidine kinase/ActR/RegA family two-component response regulator